jgi:hypothetical protein
MVWLICSYTPFTALVTSSNIIRSNSRWPNRAKNMYEINKPVGGHVYWVCGAEVIQNTETYKVTIKRYKLEGH